MLTALDRLASARHVLEGCLGRKHIHKHAGPLFYTADPDGALAQIILTISPDERANFSEELYILACVLKARDFLATNKTVSDWAEWTHNCKGLMPTDILANGIGEGFGLLRHTFQLPITDLDVMAVYDAISAKEPDNLTGDELRQIWCQTLPGENGRRAWTLVSLLYYPHIGASNVLSLIDAKLFTLEGIDRLIGSGFLEGGLPLAEVWAIMRGEK